MTNDNFTQLKTVAISNEQLLLEGLVGYLRQDLISLVEGSLSVSHLPLQIKPLSVSEENKGGKSSWLLVLEVSAGIARNRRAEILTLTLSVERNPVC